MGLGDSLRASKRPRIGGYSIGRVAVRRIGGAKGPNKSARVVGGGIG